MLRPGKDPRIAAGVKGRFSRWGNACLCWPQQAAMLAMFLVFTAAADIERPVPYQEAWWASPWLRTASSTSTTMGKLRLSGYWTGRSMDGRRSVCTLPK